MLGLALALRLAEAGRRVTVFESASEIGGLAAAWQVGGFTWDKHYHVTLLSDTRTRKLVADVGLEQELQWRETRTGFFSGGRLHSMSNSWEFLRFPPLSLVSKARLAATIMLASRQSNPTALENELVEPWLRRYSGRANWERVWLPLLRSKLGDAYTRTSAAFITATIARMYAARRQGLKREMFGYVRGGYARLLQRLGERLAELGVELRLGQRVEGVRVVDERPIVESADGRSEAFDRVALTLPAPRIAAVCPQFSADELTRLQSVEYLGIVCASVVLRRPLAGYYVTNITDEGFPFTGVIEMSALVDAERELGGRSLVYLPKYAAAGDAVFRQSDANLRGDFLAGLRRIYPDLTDADVLDFRVSRAPHVFALPTLGYSQRLLGLNTSLPGVHVASSFQIVGGTLNVNETVALAERAADSLLALPSQAATSPETVLA